MSDIKPLMRKAYGSIPHLPNSRIGSGDHHCTIGQAKIVTEKARDKHDLIIVQEKLDGSNVCVAKIDGKLYALNRAGYPANTSPYRKHQLFHKWAMLNYSRFDNILQNSERINKAFITPHIVSIGSPISVSEAMECLGDYGFHGAMIRLKACFIALKEKAKLNFSANTSDRTRKTVVIWKAKQAKSRFGIAIIGDYYE